MKSSDHAVTDLLPALCDSIPVDGRFPLINQRYRKMKSNQEVRVFVNKEKFSFDNSEQTGLSIKEAAAIPVDHTLIVGHGQYGEDGECKTPQDSDQRDYAEITDDQVVILQNGQRFWSREPQAGVDVSINRADYHFDNAIQTGQELKERAGINPQDVLFRSQPSEDEVIPNEAEITLHCGDCFYSSPPANYGSNEITPSDVGCEQFECVPQSNGWTFLVIPDFSLPDGYSHDRAQVLVKLPPGFPDAAPDMFWVSPHVKTQSGGVPQGTSTEPLLDDQWQRFSWHLGPGAWRPGVSTLRDFMRCIRSRFERRN